MRIALALTVLLALSGAQFASAHEGEHHEGGAHPHLPTTGSIASIDGDHLLLDSNGAKIAVTLTPKTTIARGLHQAERSELRPGTTISVSGTKLPTGELVASSISVLKTAGNEPAKKTPTR